MDMLTKLTVIIVFQYICLSNYRIVHLKLICNFKHSVNFISIKLEKKEKLRKPENNEMMIWG